MEINGEENRKALIYLHTSVLLAGFCGVFGRLITMNEVDIVFYRILFTIAILLVFVGLPRIGWKKFFQIIGCGALLGLHWILFYGSIKMSNVSIGVVCYALIGFFTAFIEPVVFHRKIAIREILFSLLTLVGLLLIFSFDTRYRVGIAVGAVASLVASLFLVFTKKVDEGISTRTITLYEMMGGMVGVILSAPLYLWIFPPETGVLAVPDNQNLIYLLCLALFCTVGQYMFQFLSLKHLSAFTVNLTYNLEPVYAIIIAFILFGEGREVNFSFYVGILFILACVFMQTRQTMKKKYVE